MALSQVWAKGSDGGLDLAAKVVAAADSPSSFDYLYDDQLPIREKIETIVKKLYRGSGVIFSKAAAQTLRKAEEMGLTHFPVCMAKTPYSFSDQPEQLGAPSDFTIHVSEIRISAGAGFLVVLTGSLVTMPGLPKVPAAESVAIGEGGQIIGLA